MGTEVARQFAQAGYSVRGTARSAAKIADWKKANPGYNDSIQCWHSPFPLTRLNLDVVQGVIVEDGTVPGSFDLAIKGVQYVVHSGMPFHCRCSLHSLDLSDEDLLYR